VCMFCGRAGHLDEFYFQRKRIEKRCFEYARNSYHDEFLDLPHHSYSRVSPRSYSRVSPHTFSHALPQFAHGPNHHSYGFVHERTTLSLDALVTAHVLVVVIVSRVGLVFVLEGPPPTLSRDTWTIHVFPIVVHVPLSQVVRCKAL
jgi:hypothetical protein